jgi:hypothetical protein
MFDDKESTKRFLAELEEKLRHRPQDPWTMWMFRLQHIALIIIGVGALIWSIKQIVGVFQ